MGYPRKNIFRQKYTNDMSIDAVFDEDYESAIIFGENIYIKNENRKIRLFLSRKLAMRILNFFYIARHLNYNFCRESFATTFIVELSFLTL